MSYLVMSMNGAAASATGGIAPGRSAPGAPSATGGIAPGRSAPGGPPAGSAPGGPVPGGPHARCAPGSATGRSGTCTHPLDVTFLSISIYSRAFCGDVKGTVVDRGSFSQTFAPQIEGLTCSSAGDRLFTTYNFTTTILN